MDKSDAEAAACVVGGLVGAGAGTIPALFTGPISVFAGGAVGCSSAIGLINIIDHGDDILNSIVKMLKSDDNKESKSSSPNIGHGLSSNIKEVPAKNSKRITIG